MIIVLISVIATLLLINFFLGLNDGRFILSAINAIGFIVCVKELCERLL